MLILSIICIALTANGTGMAITIMLVRIFPAKRTKDIVFYLSFCFGLFLYVIFRMIQPENLVNPENYAHFVEYFSAMSRPAGPWLPASWASDMLTGILYNREMDWLLAGLLVLTPPVLFFLGEFLMERLFFTGFTKSQESFGGYRKFSEGTTQQYQRVSPERWLAKKEMTAFFRDSAEWSQIFMIAALVVIYLYSFKVLPVERSPFRTEYLTNFVSFLNTGMAGFIITSLAARFVYPSIGAEGGAIYIILSSPVSVRRFLAHRTTFYFIPFLALSLILIVLSNHLLRIAGPVWWFSIAVSSMLSWTVVSLAVSFGTIYADFRAESRAAVQGSMGAIMFMFTAMCCVGATVISGAIPLYRLTRHWLQTGRYDMTHLCLTMAWGILTACLLLAVTSFIRRKAVSSLEG
jgi:ABC-2 type transport system permease protein